MGIQWHLIYFQIRKFDACFSYYRVHLGLLCKEGFNIFATFATIRRRGAILFICFSSIVTIYQGVQYLILSADHKRPLS